MIQYEMEENENNRVANLLFENTKESLIECITVIKDKIRAIESTGDSEDSVDVDEIIKNFEKGHHSIKNPEIIVDGKVDHPFHGYLYIVREREFVKSKEHVYKIGRTVKPNPFHRINHYPNNSSIIDIAKVFDPIKAENLLISKLDELCQVPEGDSPPKDRLTHRSDIGREYYEGDISLIRETLQSVLRT